jgi:hypothetical protein
MIKKILFSAFIIFLGLSVGNAQTTQTLTTASSSPWTVPTGVTTITVQCWGAGGGGGCGRSATGAAGGGGGGGAYTITNSIAVVAGNTINFTVGAGGTGGSTAGVASTVGGTTTFSSATPVVANGGGAGTNESANANGAGGTGGAGGTYSGGNGASGQGASGGGGGGGSAGTGSNGITATTQTGAAAVAGGGNGGTGANNATGLSPTTGPGGGGAGGERNSNSRAGGNGADGQIVITYCQAPSITTQPASFTTTTGNASFAVTATGTSPTYQWQRAVSGSTTFVNITSAGLDAGVTYSNYTTATLNLTGATGAVNNYDYQCVITACASSVTSSVAVLTYSTCPTIVQEPASETVVYSGTSTYFHVNVSSLSGTTYQWERSTDGGSTWVNIASASMDAGVSYSDYTTSTLFLSGVTPSINGYKYKCVVTSGTCSATTDGTATLIFSGSQLCGSQYRRPITINNTMVGGGLDLTNFPVLINVTDGTNLKYPGGHVANANGYDIIFTDANGTALNFQTESYTAASGNYIGWVKIPTLSASTTTTIYMYYGDGTISIDQSLPTTWDTSFVAVYHLSNYNDATVDALNGNPNSTSITGGKIANGVNGFSYINAAGGASSVYNNVTQNITVSGWVNFATKSLDQKIAGSEDNASGGWKMGVYSTNNLEFEIRDASNNPYLNRSYGSPTTLNKNTWYYVVGQYSQTGGYINTYVGAGAGSNFANGTPDCGSSYTTAGVMGVSTGTLSLGCEAFAPTTANWSGTLDEIRISKVIRSVGWLQTEYNNQNNPATYVTLGAESGTKSWAGTANWNTAADWSGASLPASGADVIISSGTVTVNSNITVGSLIVKSGAGLVIATGNTLTVSSYIMDCGIISGAGALNMGSTTSTNQNISGTGTCSLTTFVINNTATTPTVTLQMPVSVSGALTLTSGLLNTDATNIVTMQNGSTAPALTSAATSYVNGPMRYQLASTTGTTLNFPVGASPDCRPMALTLLHGTTSLYNYTAQLYDGNPWTAMGSSSSSQMPSTVDTISAIHYWTINRTDASGTSQPTLDLSGNQTIKLFFGTNDQVFEGGNSLTIVKNTAATPASWIDIGGTSSLGNFTSAQTGSVSSTSSPSAFNSFSTFSLGSKTVGWNPLPIELLSFSAVPNGDKVDIKWETITETNNAYFTVEKSKDGVNFTKLIDVPGAGNSTSYKDYAETDYQPYSGTSYYRLKQTDNNGAFKYFTIVPVTFIADGQQSIVLFPNPMIENASILSVNVNGYKGQEVVVVLRDIQGKEFLSKVLLSEDDNHVFTIEGTTLLPVGAYIVTASSNNKIYNYKIIVK